MKYFTIKILVFNYKHSWHTILQFFTVRIPQGM